MAYPRYTRSRAFKFVNGDGAGSYTTTNEAMTAVDSTDMSITLKECQVGDILRIRFRANVGNDGDIEGPVFNFYSVNRSAYLDAGASASGVDGVLVAGYNLTGTFIEFIAVLDHFYEVQAGDLVDGSVEIEVHWRDVSGSSGTMTISNTSGAPLPQFSVENLGPAQG